jgi:signal transduction histidine kinase
LKRAVATLIDNAIKNTPKGSVTLRAKAKERKVLIAVEDTGSGIPKEEADRIFDRFVKLDSFKEGLGLGLPLCRALIERLGGTVRLDTNYGPGARFVIELPNDFIAYESSTNQSQSK